MTEQNDGTKPLQFEQAEFTNEGAAQAKQCAACKNALGQTYFLANEHMVCEGCSRELQASATLGGSGAVRFARATALGLGAGAVGAGIWFAITKFTGYEIGLVALVVGFLVGGAVRYGTGGRGGWAYQALAVVITYASIVVTYVPMIVAGFDAQSAEQGTQDVDPANVARITVMRDQSVQLNGATIDMGQLDTELARVAAVGGEVWYHREGMATEQPGPAADQVAELVGKHALVRVTY